MIYIFCWRHDLQWKELLCIRNPPFSFFLHIYSDTCRAVGFALASCEARLLIAGSTTESIITTPSPCADWLSGVDFRIDKNLVPFVVCVGLLVFFVALHLIRQAWYLWGGEGAYAFPFDK